MAASSVAGRLVFRPWVAHGMPVKCEFVCVPLFIGLTDLHP